MLEVQRYWSPHKSSMGPVLRPLSVFRVAGLIHATAPRTSAVNNDYQLTSPCSDHDFWTSHTTSINTWTESGRRDRPLITIMLRTRNNQENLTHLHQTTAASKPLNQETRLPTIKTPGQKPPKTPFRNGRGDENVVLFGQTGLKPNKAKHDVFVTPASTQARAPLGIKNTNVKARALQTPGRINSKQPIGSATKQTSPRLRRSKVKIHQSQALITPEHDAEPDIEYMPPRSVPLPDYPPGDSDDERVQADAERIYQELCKENIPPPPTDEDIDYMFRRDEATQRMQDDMIAASLKQTLSYTPQDTASAPQSTTRSKPSLSALRPKPLPTKSTVSTTSKPITMDSPSFAKPTAAVLARVVPGPERLSDANLARSRTTATAAATHAASSSSRQTLGYAKGRVVSANARRFRTPGLSEAHRAPVYKKASRPVSALPSDPDGLLANFKRASLNGAEGCDLGQHAGVSGGGVLDGLDPDLVFGEFELQRIDSDED